MIYSQHKYPFDTKFVGFWWFMYYCRKIFVKTYALFPQFFCDWKADFGNFFDFRIIASASKGLFHLSVDQNKLNFSMLLFSKGWIPGREVSLSILYSDRRLNITDCTQIFPRITVTYVITTRYLGQLSIFRQEIKHHRLYSNLSKNNCYICNNYQVFGATRHSRSDVR